MYRALRFIDSVRVYHLFPKVILKETFIMSRNIHCTYISEKLSKIRWRPSTLNEPNSFVTASWDNHVNNVRLKNG